MLHGLYLGSRESSKQWQRKRRRTSQVQDTVCPGGRITIYKNTKSIHLSWVKNLTRK